MKSNTIHYEYNIYTIWVDLENIPSSHKTYMIPCTLTLQKWKTIKTCD